MKEIKNSKKSKESTESNESNESKFKLSSKYCIILLFLVLITTLMFFNTFHTKYDPLKYVSNDKQIYSASTPIVLVHDVSPVYFEEMEEIIEVLDNNHYSTRTYLFVITNHAGDNNLSDYPKFVEYLHELNDRGYHIQYHGYDHIGGEYNCSEAIANEKTDKSLKILENCGFNTKKINYVITPRYILSKDSENNFLKRNFTIIVNSYILKPKINKDVEKVIITNKEYTWYTPENCTEKVKNISLIDYKTSLKENKQFTLSIHPKAVNYGNGLEILDYFLFESNKEILDYYQ
ncbi:DUF2334 domain-containing protein [Methanococcus voltae]|uniref:Putative deacetylase n=1 Tax=Methanococcus voltae TaxID=2188 RepID=A0A8J7UV03_METVO|nr:DUF2334 domain-containing protein [Methanococcus voltae]MBP2173058.1 putative deacetylase [Methanococcus voltae]MBP2201886.1 putative deacetylase [Methanococcus voltae]